MRWFDIIKKEEVKDAILEYAQKSRWYGEKSKSLLKFEIESCFLISESKSVLAVLFFKYRDGTNARYQLFLNLVSLQNANEKAKGEAIHGVILVFNYGLERLILQDALHESDFRHFLFKTFSQSRETNLESVFTKSTPAVTLKGIRGRKFKSLAPSEKLSRNSGVLGFEQSNTSLYFGKRGTTKSLFVKFYRKLVEGKNPDAELSEFLTDKIGFNHSAKFAGEILLTEKGKDPSVVALALGFSPNQSDAWQLFKSDSSAFYSEVIEKKLLPETPPKDLLENWKPDKSLISAIGQKTLKNVARLGQRTAEMHLALSKAKGKEMIPIEMKAGDIKLLLSKSAKLMESEFKELKKQLLSFDKAEKILAERVLKTRKELLAGLTHKAQKTIKFTKQRVHGDYHLGQVLYTGTDFVIIDFEGEPARSLSERRERYPVCKDLAGMIRSLHYAAYAGIYQHPKLNEKAKEKSERYAEVWFFVLAHQYLDAYLKHTKGSKLLPKKSKEITFFLNAYLLDKVMYELAYERNNRPKWLKIPLQGILSLVKEINVK